MLVGRCSGNRFFHARECLNRSPDLWWARLRWRRNMSRWLTFRVAMRTRIGNIISWTVVNDIHQLEHHWWPCRIICRLIRFGLAHSDVVKWRRGETKASINYQFWAWRRIDRELHCSQNRGSNGGYPNAMWHIVMILLGSTALLFINVRPLPSKYRN